MNNDKLPHRKLIITLAQAFYKKIKKNLDVHVGVDLLDDRTDSQPDGQDS